MYDTMNNEKDESAIAHAKRSNEKQFPRIRKDIPPNSYMEDALNLLRTWNLLELQDTFAAHEVSTRSFKYLTDEDITELIPKIGLRTIFRAMLQDWRLQINQNFENSQPKALVRKRSYEETFVNQNNAANNHDNMSVEHIMEPTTVLKTEPTEIDADETVSAWLDTQQEHNNDPLTSIMPLEEEQHSSYNMEIEQQQRQQQQLQQQQQQQQQQLDPHQLRVIQNILRKNGSAANTVDREIDREKDYNGEPLVVMDLMSNTMEGRAALDFYKENGFIDLKNRKRIVHVLITAVVDRKINKYTAIFNDMTLQLLEIFPNEKYETYFVPHQGNNPARGALYYKYSNYTRKLRRDGLLPYKIHKPYYE